ncbi:kinesin light chain [Mytilinidion resinicola]|uniref:Kinesin light chain n=1 Tax=Mytilinidion resinicola TaxID=574789 RepID=A0A6A6Y238_9PEZI|nr:kinesin light chain [Mytilinidion resinicola]KAF2802720.1 kinesin light chain [Mytilinidion resinicola]
MASSNTQLTCADYHVAWICPLADVELLPAYLMLDEEHSTPPYSQHYDENTYICGTINGHNVVIATCPPGETGNVNAGRLTGPMFKTFPNIRMAVLVGIGGGIPSPTPSEDSLKNIHLGDVVVGLPGDGKPACVYHDRGRLKLDGKTEILGTMQNPDWRLADALGILALKYKLGQTTIPKQLERLRSHKEFAHPGFQHDRLFSATCHHNGDYESNCEACDQDELVQRPQRTKDDKNKVVFHRGRIATGTSVIQDGELRDQISARCDGALCVEMEAAGVDVNRKCLVIRGISDYADSHKNDVWKSYAAGNAAAFTRELLCRIQPNVVKNMEGVIEAPWIVPFTRPLSFVGRETQLAQLSTHISLEDCQRLAIYGLGGCGKTALALESAYRTRERQPTRAIFWVPAVSRESFEQAYREIGMVLRIPGIADAKADVKRLVKTRLSDEDSGQWLMIIDNADDTNVLFDLPEKENGANRLIDYLPHSRRGSIVFTTRTRKAAIKLAPNDVELGQLDEREAKEVLKKILHQKVLLEDDEVVQQFLEILTFLPLAIVQAVAFINENGIPLTEYILIFRNSERDATNLLSEEFEDQGRYRDTKNPVATTWYISFEQIRKQDELGAEYLSFMACTTGESIPASLLPPSASRLGRTKAIGTLKAYAFITERQPQEERQDQVQEYLGVFDVHALVHLATRNWLRERNWWYSTVDKALTRLVDVLPPGGHDKRVVWTAYLPHATHVVDLPEAYEVEARMSLLDRIGRCEHTIGRYRAAELTHRELLVRREKVLGKEHPNTLISMNELAYALSSQGKYKEAENMYQETLALREKISGKEHLDTLASMNNLTQALSSQGKNKEAEKMYQETLALREKVMNNLAQALSGQGKYKEAEKMHQETLALREKISGRSTRTR